MGPGKYSPSGEYGYLYAPLKGRRADVIRSIMRRLANHPDIPQQDVQTLLWAIISRAKISDMSEEMQETAEKLLTQEEIFELNGGALGLIPEELFERAIAHLPAEAKQVLEAEARVREMLSEGQETYEELERVAVRFGTPPLADGNRQIPPGRWSLHPNGFFIRYFPHGYTSMTTELYLPERFQVERDEPGRITMVSDPDGNRIEIEYDETINPFSIVNEPDLQAYAFRSIRLIGPDPEDPEKKLSIVLDNIGWTFLGVPSGKGRLGSYPGRFLGLEERYIWGQSHKKTIDDLEDGIKKLLDEKNVERISNGNMEKIMALGYFAVALKHAIDSSEFEREDLLADPVYMVKKAWQAEVAQYMGVYKVKPVYDPADDPPSGNDNEQPEQNSGQGDCNWDQLEEELQNDIDECFKNHSSAGKGSCDLQRLERCWWRRVLDYQSTKTGVCISSFCREKWHPSGPRPDSDLNKCIDDKLMDWKWKVEGCTMPLDD